MQQEGVVCDFVSSDSWVILSPIEQSIKRKIEAVGTPLKDWDIQIIYRGVRTGYQRRVYHILPKSVMRYWRTAKLRMNAIRTAELIRPILRGRDIKRYEYEWADLWIIATFPSRHYDIESYPAVKNYLLSIGIERLEQTGETHIVNGKKIKARKKTCNEWFETQDSISYWEDFSKPKIVWGNLNLTASYAMVQDNSFINAPSPVIVPASKFLLAVLNSKLADYYIRQLGVTRNGGYFEYKPMFVEKLPVPQNADTKAVTDIESYVDSKNETAIDKAVYMLYGLTEEETLYIDKKGR